MSNFASMQKYHPYASDPNLSGALASVLWELNLLSKHYHPTVSSMASGISMMSVANNQVLHSNTSPQQAFTELSLEKEPFIPESDTKRPTIKRKKGAPSHHPATTGLANLDSTTQVDQNAVSKKLSEHFLLIRNITENERLRSELDRTTSSLELFEQFKKQKRRKTK